MYYSKGDAIGTKVSVRYRRSGRLSEVVVKRGSTVNNWPALKCALIESQGNLNPWTTIVGLEPDWSWSHAAQLVHSDGVITKPQAFLGH